jgi:hypothetical protein
MFFITTGSGVLDWKVASNQEVKAGTGITITYLPLVLVLPLRLLQTVVLLLSFWRIS